MISLALLLVMVILAGVVLAQTRGASLLAWAVVAGGVALLLPHLAELA